MNQEADSTEADISEIQDEHVPHPSEVSESSWKNDLSLWPNMTKENIEKYLLETPGIDGLPNNAQLSVEAVDFLISGWVDTVLICDTGKESVLLKSKVARSQSTTKDDHSAWVLCKKTGDVVTGSCSCMAGLGRVCSHVAAILFKILEANKKSLNNKSCTDSPMIWNRSTRRNVFPEKVKNIKRKKHYSNNGSGVISPTKKFQQFYSHEDLLENTSVSPFLKLMNLDSSLWNTILLAPENTSSVSQAQPQILHTSHEGNYSLDGHHQEFRISCELCNTFYKKYVELTAKQRTMLGSETIIQASSDLWIDSRKIRLTASTASKCPKRIDTMPDKFLKSHVYGTFKGNSSTEHGILCEPEAIEAFKQMTSLDVIKAGTIVSEKDNWLSASPDGLVGSDGILEVKCPIKDVSELVCGGKYDVRKIDEHELTLHKSGKNGYFLQVQLLMHCTNRSTCYFFVWGKKSSAFVTVEYDEAYVMKELERLRTFYFTKMLPFLCTEKEEGKLLFGRKFLNLLKQNQIK